MCQPCVCVCVFIGDGKQIPKFLALLLDIYPSMTLICCHHLSVKKQWENMQRVHIQCWKTAYDPSVITLALVQRREMLCLCDIIVSWWPQTSALVSWSPRTFDRTTCEQAHSCILYTGSYLHMILQNGIFTCTPVESAWPINPPTPPLSVRHGQS